MYLLKEAHNSVRIIMKVCYFVGAVKGLSFFFLIGLSTVNICTDVPQTLVKLFIDVAGFECAFKELDCRFLIFGVQIFCNLTSSCEKKIVVACTRN